MIAVRNIAAAIFLLWLAAAGAAEAREPMLNQLFRSNNNFLRVNLLGGRLMLKATQMPPFNRSINSEGLKEVLRFWYDNGQPMLSDEQTARDQRLTFNLSGSGDNVCIRRLPLNNSKIVPLEFKQSLKEKTSLTVGSGDRKRVFVAADLWRLMVMQPEECRRHLFPLLAVLRSDWKLAEMASSVESTLLDGAYENAAANARWATLVEQLGDDRFAKREAADRELRAGGALALKYLKQLDLDRLDAEQQFRVRRIIEALVGLSEDDSAAEAAASMAGDPLVWLTLLSRPEAATRRIAAKQLAALLGESIKVDPAAKPDSQKTERDRLRAKIESERQQ